MVMPPAFRGWKVREGDTLNGKNYRIALFVAIWIGLFITIVRFVSVH